MAARPLGPARELNVSQWVIDEKTLVRKPSSEPDYCHPGQNGHLIVGVVR